MKLDKALMEKVARNARLNLSEEEIKKFLPELNGVLDYFSTIAEADTRNIQPSFHPIEIKNVMRDDIVEECLSQEEALSNAKHKKDGFFKGPKVV